MTDPEPRFGARAGDEHVPLSSVPRNLRRATIRCEKDHLVGVVTDDELFLGGPPKSLRSTHRPVVRCPKCPRWTPDYAVEMPKLRTRLANSTVAPLKLRLAEVATPLLENHRPEG